jgi:hypothetical protein
MGGVWVKAVSYEAADLSCRNKSLTKSLGRKVSMMYATR